MNIIVCGSTGTGKSTAIRRLLQCCAEPIYGFWTEKLAPDFDGRAPVYIHGCREPLSYAPERRIGLCANRHAAGYAEVFDTCGVSFLQNIPSGALVLMDELGVMENRAEAFQEQVFSVLSGDYRVLAAVRDRSTALLDAVRAHPASLCVSAAEANTPEFLARALQELKPHRPSGLLWNNSTA